MLKIPVVEALKPAKEKERYYLLPGQGRQALRQKRNSTLVWSVSIGLLVSAVLSFIIYWNNQGGR